MAGRHLMGNRNSTGLPSRARRAGWAVKRTLFDTRDNNEFDISQPLTPEEQKLWGTSSDKGTGGKTAVAIEEAHTLQEASPKLEWPETVVQKAKPNPGANLGKRKWYVDTGKAAGPIYISDIKMVQDPDGYTGQLIPLVDVAIVQKNVPFQMGNKGINDLDVWQHVLVTKGELEKAAGSVKDRDGGDPEVITTLSHNLDSAGNIIGLKSGGSAGAQKDLAQQAGHEAHREAKMGEAVQHFQQSFPTIVFHLRPGSSAAGQEASIGLGPMNFEGTEYRYEETHQNNDGSITAHAPTVDVYAVDRTHLDDRAGQLNFVGTYEIDEGSHPELGNKEKEGAFLQFTPSQDFVSGLNYAAEGETTINPFGDKVGKFVSFAPTQPMELAEEGRARINPETAPSLEDLLGSNVVDVQFKLRQLKKNYGKLGQGRSRLFGRVLPAQNSQGFSMAGTDHQSVDGMMNNPVAAVVMPRGSTDGKKRDSFLETAQTQFKQGAGGADQWQKSPQGQEMGRTVKHDKKGGSHHR